MFAKYWELNAIYLSSDDKQHRLFLNVLVACWSLFKRKIQIQTNQIYPIS